MIANGRSDAALQARPAPNRKTLVRLRILGESLVEVGEEVVSPSSPRLFALALFLGYVEGRSLHKSELCDLLFPDAGNRKRASHSLRQLLYRLRRLGEDVRTIGDRACLPRGMVTSTFQTFLEMPRAERMRCRSLDLAILPAYEPRISRQFSEWVETVRIKEQARVRAVLREDFVALEQACHWEGVITVGRTLQELQMATEDVVCGMAQALVLRGRKHEALDVIDSFLRDGDTCGAATLRQLRSRIARAEGSSRVLESAFHGRRAVLQALGGQWEATMALVPQLAVVTGPAGIGKTRLAQEFISYVQLRGGRYLYYRCERSDSARPYALFRGVLPQLRRMRGSLGASPDLRVHLDRLSSDSTASGALESVAGEAMRTDIQIALLDLLEAVSTERSLLLVVDDAQLQDSASSNVSKAIVASGTKAGVMIVWCNRTPDADEIGADHGLRGQVYRLAPLSAEDSLSVLSDLLPEWPPNDPTLAEWSARAGGNPYYLHAIAYELSAKHLDAPATFGIQRFAAAAYYALSLEARTVYESCILLGPLATLQRVARVADVRGQTLISALRDLETHGMIAAQGAALRCAHALLEEASLGLIPHLVATLLRTRIASALEEECAAADYPADLSWAAADHWIAIGEVGTAARLLRRCASQAAALGEPGTAAKALLHIPIERLGLSDRASVLSELAEYSELASEFPQASKALQALRRTTLEMRYPESAVREMDLRITEAELRHGADPTVAIPGLQRFIEDPCATNLLKARAGAIVLIAADMDLNASLAEETYTRIGPALAACSSSDYGWQRAEIVFHTVFGDKTRALQIVAALLDHHSVPTIAQGSVGQRRNIAYSLVRLALYDQAKVVLRADYDYMTRKHVSSEAAYRMALLGEIAVNEGDFDEAQRWIGLLGEMVASNPSFAAAIQAGYYSAAAELALHQGRLDQARPLVDLARTTYPAVRTARYAAIASSLQLRIALVEGALPSEQAVAELTDIYHRGAHLGMQDEVVEALWLANHLAGKPADASRLLLEYLTLKRREYGPPRWSLRETTKADPAWSAARSQLAEDRPADANGTPSD